jgi:hypothetical protein
MPADAVDGDRERDGADDRAGDGERGEGAPQAGRGC